MSFRTAHCGHNAPSGLWSIITGSHAPTTSLGAYDGSFAAGLLEAIGQAQEEDGAVLPVAYDVPPPQALAAQRSIGAPFATALLFTARSWTHSFCNLRTTSNRPKDMLYDPGLEAVRAGNPAGRCLLLLRIIALSERGSAVLPYLAPLQLLIEHVPC